MDKTKMTVVTDMPEETEETDMAGKAGGTENGRKRENGKTGTKKITNYDGDS